MTADRTPAMTPTPKHQQQAMDLLAEACGVSSTVFSRLMPDATVTEDAALRAIAAALAQSAQQADADEDAYVIDRLAHLLAEISVIVNGPEPAGTKWSYHDLPAKVRALAAQPAAGRDLAELVEAMDLPEGYTVVEELPGVWTYSHMQGEQRMVCSASWNHPALAACAAWNDTAAQRPGAGDDTARLDWLDSQVQFYGDGYTEPREAGWCVQWQQSKPDEYWTNLRDWIDGEMARTADAFGEFSQPASGEAKP